MDRRTHIIVATLFALGLSACGTSRVAFLHAYRQPGKLGGQELKRLQFYVSEDIVLRRVEDTSEHGVTSEHAYRAVQGQLEEVVELPRGTPGLVTKIDKDTLWVSFEEDGALPFQHLPKVDGETGETYRFPYRLGRRLRYRGHYFEVIEGGLGDGPDTFLLVEAEHGLRMEDQRRTMPGRRLADAGN